MAYPYTITTRAAGSTLTANIYNADHQNHPDSQTPANTDDYSSNAAQMQTNTDPGEVGTESLATTLQGEIERLRFAIKDLKTFYDTDLAQWYQTPTALRLNADILITSAANRTEATAQYQIQGLGYTAYHWMNGTAYYIGQNSAVRSLRMYSGAAPTTGVELTNGATSWAATSDESLKTIIEPIQNATTKVVALRHVIGRFKTDDVSVRRSFLIAQDVERVFPEAVSKDRENLLSLRYQDIIPLHGAAISEMASMVAAQESRLSALENERMASSNPPNMPNSDSVLSNEGRCP